MEGTEPSYQDGAYNGTSKAFRMAAANAISAADAGVKPVQAFVIFDALDANVYERGVL
jgi:hypothetical protein